MIDNLEVAVITTPERTDRHGLFAVFAAGAHMKYRWHTTDPVLAPAGYRASQQAYNCARSHGMLLAESDTDLLVLEDDAAVPVNFLGRVEEILDDLPHHWQVLKLGGQHAYMPFKVKSGLVLCEHTIRTHAYFVRGEFRAQLSGVALNATTHWDAEYALTDRGGHNYAPDPFLVPVFESTSGIPDSLPWEAFP